jgi:hypothetical protein
LAGSERISLMPSDTSQADSCEALASPMLQGQLEPASVQRDDGQGGQLGSGEGLLEAMLCAHDNRGRGWPRL